MKKISLILSIFFLAFFLSPTTAVASLNNATVEISPKKTGVPVQYTIGFYVSSSGELEGGRDEIIIYFPEGTVLPDSLQDNLDVDSILVNGVSVDSRSLYADETRLIITLPSAVNVRANGYVGIIISPTAGIELSRKAGSHYLEIETSRDQKVRTNTFTVEGSKISQLAITATPSAADKFAEYEFSFCTSFRGELLPEKDEIYIEFDREIYLPRSIASGDIEIDGIKAVAGGVKVNNETNTLQITVPPEARIDNNAKVVVKIDSRAGIRNPRRAGIYRIKVYTSADTVSAWEDYRVGLAIITPVVFISPDTVGEKSQYTIGFTTSTQGALRPGKDYIYLDFPSETYIPANILTKYVTINGQNAFDVETFPRRNAITLTVPYGVQINDDSYVNIVFKNEAGIRNPDIPDEYQIAVSTTADKNEVKSKQYTVTKPSSTSSSRESDKPDIFLSTYRPEETTNMQITFKEGTLGDLRGDDKINLIFPVAYKIRGQLDPQYVTVNGREVEKLELIGQTLVLTVPYGVDLSAQELTEIKIDSQVGITNPDREGDYSLLLCSSLKYDQLFNYTVRISDTAIGNTGEKPSVELSSRKPGESSSYFVFFINNISGTLREGDTISLSFPTGTLVPQSLSRSFVKVNGKVPDQVRVAGNKVTLYLPGDLRINENASITVLIEEMAGIENPRTAGGYNLVVETSLGYFALSEEYKIEAKESEEENEDNRTEGAIVFKIDSKVAYNGNIRIDLDTAPTILQNFTVVPLRALGDALGAETQYEDATKTVRVKYQNKELVFYIDSKLVKVNNEWKVIDIPATLINNRVMIPARFVSESFGAAVVWEENTREVIITK